MGASPTWSSSVSGAYIERWFLDAPETHIFYIVYKTTCLIDGKVYVGKHKTADLDDGYLGSGKLLTRAIKKHGIQSFQKEVLYVFDNEEEMNLKEAELVTEEFCSRKDTYNLCPGGKGGWGYINQNGLCPTFRRKVDYSKVSLALKEKYSTDLAYQDMLNKAALLGVIQRKLNHPDTWWKGKKHSIETRQKMKVSCVKKFGSDNPQSGKKWITNGSKTMMVLPSELENYLSCGYRIGRK